MILFDYIKTMDSLSVALYRSSALPGYILYLIDNELYKEEHGTCFLNGGPRLHCPYFKQLHLILNTGRNVHRYFSYMELFVESLTVL